MEDIHRIIEVEQRHPELVLKFGFNHRCHAAVKEAKAVIESGRLGRLLWARGVYGKGGGPGFEHAWRSQADWAGGGILLDQGIHLLDLFRYFCGDFDEVKSVVTRSYWKDIDVEDNAFAILRNRSRNVVAMLHSSSTHWKHVFALDLYLTEGYVSVNGIVTGSRTYGRETLIVGRRQAEGTAQEAGNPREEIVYFDHDPSWREELDEFAAAVLQGTPVSRGTSLDALKAMELVFEIYRADESWQQVRRG